MHDLADVLEAIAGLYPELVRPILTWPKDTAQLTTRAAEIHAGRLMSEPAYARWCHTIEDRLRATLLDANGAGLAAPQIGIPHRAIAIRYGGLDIVLFNPTWTRIGEQRHAPVEGCLSFPGVQMPTVRDAHGTLEGWKLDGTRWSWTGTGTVAVIAQHEIDHLDGRLMLTRSSSPAAVRQVRDALRDRAKRGRRAARAARRRA